MAATKNNVSQPAVAAERVLVLDFGGQYAQLITRRVREQHVYGEIVRHDITAQRVRELAPKGLILSGGPASVYAAGAPQCDPALFDLGIPMLGICYGMQLMCQALGGRVQNHPVREFGRAHLTVNSAAKDANELFAGVPQETEVWMSHGDQVDAVSDDFVPLAQTGSCLLAAVKHRSRPLYGLQFHPEVTHTPDGKTILANFLTNACRCTGTWRLGDFAEQTIRQVRERVGSDRVICGLSGGVDSSVVAALLYRAIGPQLSCILVDNGLLRKDEEKSVIEEFTKHFKSDLHVVKAEGRFLSALAGVTDPQEKRRLIGHAFIECFAAEARKIQGAKFLAQGTLYPDVIESGAAPDGPADTIKLHHNVGGLPAELEFELIEPLRDLFKDEVRQLGSAAWPARGNRLAAPIPRPGPGRALPGRSHSRAARHAARGRRDRRQPKSKRPASIAATSQAFAVLLPVQSVGVMGDARTYDDAFAVRCVTTDDFMTADWTHLPHDLLARISTRIINEVKGVNRVVYDISSQAAGDD